MKNVKNKRGMTATDFIALSDREKNRIFAALDAETPQQRLAKSKPLNARERTEWRKIQTAMHSARRGRPRLGKNGVAKVSISVERSLLERIDRYAEDHKLNRSEMFTQGVAALIGKAG